MRQRLKTREPQWLAWRVSERWGLRLCSHQSRFQHRVFPVHYRQRRPWCSDDGGGGGDSRSRLSIICNLTSAATPLVLNWYHYFFDMRPMCSPTLTAGSGFAFVHCMQHKTMIIRCHDEAISQIRSDVAAGWWRWSDPCANTGLAHCGSSRTNKQPAS